jgi:beta-glucosidase/6-phospho-beta-glucosidase/beta-galactosidase
MGMRSTPEVWGGIECSFSRVQNVFGDQLDYCGHYRRGIEDIEHIAGLGIRALRYPVIWERLKPHADSQIPWSWVERQLNALRHFNILPIAGLVHHGSGPLHACLSESCFATEIEIYARQVAEKFPWIEYYTPVNEPLTTARFCGLYGYWYPHRKSDKAFVEMLLTEIKAIVLAMKAIRNVNSGAKLVQTEDLGKIYSTKRLKYQADFENERRWLTYDLLTGFVKPGHALWDYFLWLGIEEKSLYYFVENTCPPDIIGADYYLTSERFLDSTPEKYPLNTYGSNGKHIYADVEAIRVKHSNPSGLSVLLRECWERYKIPIAVTEVHINGSAEDQIRWFKHIWDTCLKIRTEGVDLRAVTAWAMFGTYGWSKLLTENPGEYERGVFDVSSGSPQTTEYTEFIKRLTKDPDYLHPACFEIGWWEHEGRLLYKEMLR